MPVVEAEPLVIETDDRLADQAYWRRLGEEHGQPLIVTGSLRWLFAPAKIEQRGRRTIYLANGRAVDATVIVIDGRSGKIVANRTLHQAHAL